MPQPTTQTRWTQDTRIAFLLALRLTGTVMRAATEIGRKPAVCYKVRERDAAFAAQWDAIVAGQRAARRVARVEGEAAPVDAAAAVTRDAAGHRKRRDAMTVVKRRAFLRALSESGTVAAACQAAGVSDTAAYRLRGDDADFANAWDRALRTAAPALEQIAWERAVEGWEEPVFAGGKQVGTRRKRSDVLLRQLILKREKAAALADDPAELMRRAKAAARAAGGTFDTPATRQDLIDKLNKLLDGRARALAQQRGAPKPDDGDDWDEEDLPLG